jgi:cytochrome P450
MRTKAASDAGVLFGLSSNAIPAASWMLLHILDPNGGKTVLPRLLKELQSARDGDEINVPQLVSLPLFQSILQEVLRLYTDMLVVRDLPAELQLPARDGKSLLFRKGDLVLAPSWIEQRGEEEWSGPSSEVFYAERFLKRDPETGRESFTMDGTAGKLFPFGGGKTICPGRVFAKQEILGCVATVLLNYDIEAVNFVDGQGKETERFPVYTKTFAGSGVLPADGDLKVKIKRRG